LQVEETSIENVDISSVGEGQPNPGSNTFQNSYILQNFSLDSKRDAPIYIDGSDPFVFIAKVKLDPENLEYKKIMLRSIPRFEDVHDTILNTIAAHTSI